MRRFASDCCKPPHHRSRHSLPRSIRSSSPRLHAPATHAAIENDAAPLAAAHGRPVQYSQNHAYRQEAPTRLPHSFLAEGPKASRALSAYRASSSLSSMGSSPAWPSPCRGRPSGRRGRTCRATIRACGLWPARCLNLPSNPYSL